MTGVNEVVTNVYEHLCTVLLQYNLNLDQMNGNYVTVCDSNPVCICDMVFGAH